MSRSERRRPTRTGTRGERDGEAVPGAAAAERNSPVAGAYTDVDGEPAFVIAALDREGAWIAVPRGTEVDATDWH